MADTSVEIIRGDDEAIEVTIKDENGDSLLKSGNVIFLTVKKHIKDADADAQYTEDHTLGADTDLFTIDLSNTETELPLGSYFADVQWRDNASKIKTIWRGQFIVSYDVSRRKIPA